MDCDDDDATALPEERGAQPSGGSRELALARVDATGADFGGSLGRHRRRAPSSLRRIDPTLAICGACLLGLGWLIGVNMFDRHAEIAHIDAQLRQMAVRVSATSVRAERSVRAATAAHSRETHLLALREASLRGEINTLKTRLDATTRQTQAREAELSATLAKLGKDPRFDQISARLDRIEKLVTSETPTGSIAPAKPTPAAAAKAASAPAAQKRSAGALSKFTLRGVDRGVALVDDGGYLVEVAPGDYLDGAGRIERFERRSGRWVVVTSKGVISQD